MPLPTHARSSLGRAKERSRACTRCSGGGEEGVRSAHVSVQIASTAGRPRRRRREHLESSLPGAPLPSSYSSSCIGLEGTGSLLLLRKTVELGRTASTNSTLVGLGSPCDNPPRSTQGIIQRTNNDVLQTVQSPARRSAGRPSMNSIEPRRKNTLLELESSCDRIQKYTRCKNR